MTITVINEGLENRLKKAQSIFEGIRNTPKIPELMFESTSRYDISTFDEVLLHIIENNEVLIVAGAYFGDEGKGKTVDAIAHHVSLIARVNSGENAGHTILHDGQEYIFHLVPSGILVPNKKSVIGPECVMDPISFMETEINQLIKNNISYKDKLSIGNIHIVNPYHKLMDLLGNIKNASTLKGMSPVHSSKVQKRGLRLDHLFNSEDIQVKRLEKDMQQYTALAEQNGWDDVSILDKCLEKNSGKVKHIPDHVIQFLKENDKIGYIIDLYKQKVVNNPDFPRRENTTKLIRDVLKRGEKILIEGPQSLYLSNGVETFWESSTSADTSAAGIAAATKYNFGKYKTGIINVHKLPTSRVGNGANPSGFVKQDFFSRNGFDDISTMPDECTDFDAIQRQYFNSIRENGILEPTVYKDNTGSYLIGEAMAISASRKMGEFGATTKKPRVLGLFDCVMGHDANEIQGPYLTITAPNRLDEFDKVGVVVGYVYHHLNGEVTDSNGIKYENGDIIRPGDELPGEQVLSHCHPIFKVSKGWKENPIEVGKRDLDAPIPEGLQELIGTIEHFTGFKIISLGHGRGTEDMLYIKKAN